MTRNVAELQTLDEVGPHDGYTWDMSRNQAPRPSSPGIEFVAEPQNGYDEFKRVVAEACLRRRDVLVERAYLAETRHQGERRTRLAFCLFSEAQTDDNVLSEIGSIFRRMFAREHMDILCVSHEQEIRLRRVCCPFYSAWRFARPDFYWVSSDGSPLDAVRQCYKERRLSYRGERELLLCEIDPPWIGQPLGLGGEDLERVVFTHRHRGYSLFSISDWPAYVHVGRLLADLPRDAFAVAESDVAFFQWAELYSSSPSRA